jgi:hypothetical protein
MVLNSAPGRHPTRQRLVNRPGRGTQIPQSRSKDLSAHSALSARIFRETLLTHTTLITHTFRTTPPCPSRGPFNPPRRTAETFSALFFAQTPLRGGSARTSLDSAQNRPDLSTFRKQRAWRPRQRIIHSVASLPADLVRLVRLIRTFLQRTIPDSAPNRHPGQSFHPSPATLSTSSGQQQGLFARFAHFSHFFAAASLSAGSARTKLDSAKNKSGLSTSRKQRARRGCRSAHLTHSACRKPANR